MFVNKLVPLPKPEGRIVTLSSAGRQISNFDLDDPNFERTGYQPFLGYGRSKTANILYAVALDNRLKGRGIRATSLHPGGLSPQQQAEIRKMVTRGDKTAADAGTAIQDSSGKC